MKEYLVRVGQSLRVVGLILLSLSPSMNVCSQDDDFALQSQELFYDCGMSLVAQDEVIDWQSLKDAGTGVYNQVQDFQEIVNILIIMNQEIDESDILSFDQLIDMFDDHISQSVSYEDVKLELITLVACYQRVFSVFIETCSGEPTFENYADTVYNYLASSDSLDDEMADALNDFQDAFNDFQDRLEDLF